MTEIDFHQKRIGLCTSIIEGLIAQNSLFELYNEMNPLGNIEKINKMLDTAKENETLIKVFSNLYGDSEKFLLARGLDPYGPMTKQERKEFNKNYPDPYRLRVPAWLRMPIIKFFKSFKIRNHEKEKSLTPQ